MMLWTAICLFLSIALILQTRRLSLAQAEFNQLKRESEDRATCFEHDKDKYLRQINYLYTELARLGSPRPTLRPESASPPAKLR